MLVVLDRHDVAGDDKSRWRSCVICSTVDQRPELVMFPAELELVATDQETACFIDGVDVYSRKRALNDVKDHLLFECHGQDRPAIAKCIRIVEVSIRRFVEVDRCRSRPVHDAQLAVINHTIRMGFGVEGEKRRSFVVRAGTENRVDTADS